MQADLCSGKNIEGLKMFRVFFITEQDPPTMAEPGKRAFDDVAPSAKAAAMFAVSRFGQQRDDPIKHDRKNDLAGSVGAVTEHASGAVMYPPMGVRQLWDFANQFQRRLVVAPVRWRGMHQERCSGTVGNQVSFAAIFGSVSGIGTGMSPPKSARRRWASMTARDKSICPRAASSTSNASCSRSHTPAAVHSLKRRQTVVGDPHSSWSNGTSRHGQPDWRTKMIPARQARSGTGLRPPLLPPHLWGGNNGSILCQSSSGTNASCIFMAVPPGLALICRNHVKHPY